MKAWRKYQRAVISGGGMINKKFNFKIVDISASGAKILSHKELNLNEHIDISLTIKGHLYEKNFKLHGTVIHDYSKNNQYIYGIRFTKMSHEDQIHIDEIIYFEHSSNLKHHKISRWND